MEIQKTHRVEYLDILRWAVRRTSAIGIEKTTVSSQNQSTKAASAEGTDLLPWAERGDLLPKHGSQLWTLGSSVPLYHSLIPSHCFSRVSWASQSQTPVTSTVNNKLQKTSPTIMETISGIEIVLCRSQHMLHFIFISVKQSETHFCNSVCVAKFHDQDRMTGFEMQASGKR